ncbi:MAG: ParM/StbA family protein [Coleofasciculus sp. S288]|nr:ParM/StbA family protein [Coleofasciculus sp. S288]
MARPKKKRIPDLIVALDFGGSLTKGIYTNSPSSCNLLSMEPEVISVPKAGIESYEATKLGTPDPADSAWLGLDEEHYYAVGYLASSQFNANPGLSSFKYERALFKTLAAVWVASCRLGLKNKFSAALCTLLPPGEYDNASRLREMIANKLKDFETPTGILNVSLNNWDCKPEGSGVYLYYSHACGGTLKQKTAAVVMIGYRNASVLVSERGIVGKRVTSNLGFVRLVEAVEKRVSSVVPTSVLASAIARAGDNVEQECLQPLIMSSLQKDRETDLDRLVEAVRAAREQYALSVTSWLKEVLPKGLDEVMLSGGTAEYLQPELEEYFTSTQVVWNGNIQLPESLQDPLIGNRMVDVYGMYWYFMTVVGQSFMEEVSNTKLA